MSGINCHKNYANKAVTEECNLGGMVSGKSEIVRTGSNFKRSPNLGVSFSNKFHFKINMFALLTAVGPFFFSFTIF